MRLLPVINVICCSVLALPSGRGAENNSVSYEPTVVTLEGTIVREKFPEDGSPLDRGGYAWILRMEHPITVVGEPGADLNTTEANVTEIHLNAEPGEFKIPKAAFGKKRFAVTGTLYHSHTVHHLRPVVMMVSKISPAGEGAPR